MENGPLGGAGETLLEPIALSLKEIQGHIGWKNFEARAVERPFAFMGADGREYSDPEQLEKNVLEFLSQPKEEDISHVTGKE